MLKNNIYGKGYSYEAFVRRANKVSVLDTKNDKYYSAYFELLYYIKYEDYNMSGAPTYEKQLANVKKCLSASMLKMIKRVKEHELKDQLEILTIKIENANSAEALLVLINKALAITQEYKEY